MHIGFVGPIATADVVHLLDANWEMLPTGYEGAPLLATMINELIARGHKVSAWTLTRGLPLHQGNISAKGPNLTLFYVPMRMYAWRRNEGMMGRIVDLFRFEVQELSKSIMTVKPDVLHAHWAYEFALAVLRTNLPHVVTCHDSPYTIAWMTSTSRPTQSLYRWMRVLMARRVLQQARIVTAVSPYLRDAVQTMTNASMKVVPNPVDPLAMQMASNRSFPTIPKIAMVCNGWGKRKNPQSGLIAFAKLREKYPFAELHLYGSDFGPGQTAYQWCVSNNIAIGMVFHGKLPHSQLLRELSKSHVFLHTAREESFGMVIAEAMAIGLPVVAGQASGAVPWVVGNGGKLCDITNPDTICAALEAVLIPDTYTALSEYGIREAQANFSVSAVIDQFESLYQTAIYAR